MKLIMKVAVIKQVGMIVVVIIVIVIVVVLNTPSVTGAEPSRAERFPLGDEAKCLDGSPVRISVCLAGRAVVDDF